METIATYFTNLFSGNTLAIIGAALAVILPGIGSARGVNLVARATAGLISEDPNKYGKSMLLQALPMTQGIYGFVLAILGMSAITPDMTLAAGWKIFGAAMPLALTGLISAIFQGRTAVGGIYAIAKNESLSGKLLLFPAMVETYAILGLVVSILLMSA